jgi:two-component system nitrogen regulation response regulator NtrX
MTGASVLVVDDELGIRSTINEILSDEGYAVQTAADAAEARVYYDSGTPDLVLLDIWMPDTDGITLLKQWSSEGALKCPIVVMSGHGTVETAVEATRLGAFDYIEKPLSLAQLLRTVETALRNGVDAGLAAPAEISRYTPAEMPQGKSPLIEAAKEQAQAIAGQSSPALITGEFGAGRDMFARFIHESGDNAEHPFVAVAGAALADENALEQLVGIASARGEEAGLLQQAEGGTLFISELQDLGQKAQSLLLGFIEQGSFTRPGRAQPEPINIRFMASVRPHAGEGLRADMLAAMGVMQLMVPPLREYSEDVPGLLSFYADQIGNDEQLAYRRFSVAAQNRLRNYPWPGNLRELKNLVRRLLLAGGPEEIGLRETEANLHPPTSESEPLVKRDLLALPMREAREQFERAYLTQQLALCGGKVGKLAERVGMERTHLYRKLRALGVDFRQG